MVNCNALPLASGIFLFFVGSATITPTPAAVRTHQSSQTGILQANAADAITPIRRVAILVEPVNGLADPIVKSLYNRTLAQRIEKKRKRSLPRPKLPGEVTDSPAFTLPGSLAGKPIEDLAEKINAEQLTALADLYLVDSIRTKLASNFRITALETTEVDSAISELHLSRSQAAESDGAQKLCNRLDCDAVVVIGIPAVTTRERTTRELILRTTVHLAGIHEHNVGFIPTHKPESGASKVGAAHAPVRFLITGAAVSNRSFMHAGFSSSFADLSQQAAAQAAAIALHSFSTSEQAPFMSPDTRVAIAPSFGPDRADLLVLARTGRYTEIGAVGPLQGNVSAFFKPELLPVSDANRSDSKSTAAALKDLSVNGSAIWRDNEKPDSEQVRRLARKLRVQYVLLAHVTDVEVSTAPPEDGSNHGVGTQDLSVNPAAWERQAHAEAYGALVRAQDGAVAWTDRGDTTVTSRVRVATGERAAAHRRIAIEAEKYALIDLDRRFATFRAQFEQ